MRPSTESPTPADGALGCPHARSAPSVPRLRGAREHHGAARVSSAAASAFNSLAQPTHDRPHRGALQRSSSHPEVLELPGIGLVDILGEEFAAALQWGPVALLADDRAEIAHADLGVALEAPPAGLNDALVGILQRPDDAREHRRHDLDRGLIVARREPVRLVLRDEMGQSCRWRINQDPKSRDLAILDFCNVRSCHSNRTILGPGLPAQASHSDRKSVV